MKTFDVVSLSFFIVASVLIYFALKHFNKTKDLLSNGIKTKGLVVDLKTITGDDKDTYLPVISYVNKAKDTIIFKSQVSSNPPAYKMGDTVEIVYSKNSKSQKIISFWGLYRWTVILLMIASPLFILGASHLLYKYS